ncbi:protein FLC EXPRESSOR-like [Phoenix dactylifera]|uniref:Protein FLC EXPRESSOR-like n=1 Tax=Phoenix dactylifera TaxID=42345 RepID=A0A8B7CIF1_PHODC|nr:protein FLC EXPRESSOR-like [Phoenix dactylifera]
MAGRSRNRPHVLQLRDQPPPLLGRAPPPPPAAASLPPHHPAALIDDLHFRRLPLPVVNPPPRVLALEDHLAAQHREIQALLLDNQRLAATHVALKQELTTCQNEHRRADAATAKIKAEKDAQLREVYDRSLKAEAEVRAIDGMRAELAQVRTEVQNLGSERDELVERLQGLNGELARANAEFGQAAAVRAEIEFMHKEIQKGRAAVEYEKKILADNLGQSQAMEKNMISMAWEVEKLRDELANAEKRARAAAAAAVAANPGPGYTGACGNSEMAYGGTAYADNYSMHQVQRGLDSGSQYGSVAVSHGSYDIQQTHAHR